MPRAKRVAATKTEAPAKPAITPTVEKKNGNGHSVYDLESAIRLRAYELYEKRGRQDGFAQDDWFQAEMEIKLVARATA